jgi:hypothetical protein
MLGGAIIFLTAPPNHATKGYRNGAPRHNPKDHTMINSLEKLAAYMDGDAATVAAHAAAERAADEAFAARVAKTTRDRIARNVAMFGDA